MGWSVTKELERWLVSRDASIRWVEPATYATRVVASGDRLWPCRPQSAATVLARANAALKSRIASLPILPAITGDPPEVDHDDPLGKAEEVLESAAGVDNARAVVRTVTGMLAGRFDVMLSLPSPLALLRRFGLAADVVPSLDDLDDAAVALSGVVRALGEFDLAGVVLATPADSVQAAIECESLESIVGSVHHQRRVVALRLEGSATEADFSGADIDVMLRPNLPPSAFATVAAEAATRIGGGLDAAFWMGEDFPDDAHDLLYYGDAPANMAPEQILARLDSLHIG